MALYRSSMVVIGLMVCVVAAAGITRHAWMPLVVSADTELPPLPTNVSSLSGGADEQVTLSAQAQKNLGLRSRPLLATTYAKTIEVPGIVVDRPGISDRGVVAPVTSVVTDIHHYPGDTVDTGEPLFTLRLVGESFQTAQTALFKAIKDREIAQEHMDRLRPVAETGALSSSRLIELGNEVRRLEVGINAYRQELQIRGLLPEQIDAVAEGEFISEVVVRAPPKRATPATAASDEGESHALPTLPAFEFQELNVELGQQVQAGEKLCTLSHHQSLFVKGLAFRQELPLLQHAAETSLPIQIELVEDVQSEWKSPIPSVAIHHISNMLDEKNRTVSFFLPLENEHRTYEREGQTLFLWRFRPGQRVRLRVNVEQLENVFVLPAEAVVQEGPEFYVFRQNGDIFERKPVHVVHRTQQERVIANDGSVAPGVYVAQSGAMQLNRVLKSQGRSTPSGVHVHADGSVHANH